MTSLIIDSEQQKLLQSFTPASQPDTASLHDKEASALGKSRDTAICIPSDVESDTEDDDNANQGLDGSKSCATRTSTLDYLGKSLRLWGSSWEKGSNNRCADLTITEYGAAGSEATIGANTASAVSPTQADATPAQPNESKESHLVDTGLCQQSCAMNPLLVGNTSTKCQDINLTTPPTSPKSQPYPVAANGKPLRPEPANQQSNMMADAVSDHDVCHNSQGRNSPATCIHSPRTASPVEMAQPSLRENTILVGDSCNVATPEACTPSPARHPPEPHQGQALENASGASMLIESETTEAGSGSEARRSSTSPSLSRSRHRSLQTDKDMQPEDSDAGREGPGSEDGLGRLESQRREQIFPPLSGGRVLRRMMVPIMSTKVASDAGSPSPLPVLPLVL
ncbi:hypothetical protein IL306_007413 [Fusarium sp. DS 682]|nr:hypothetical protein IL306_007413 [Fusarium sp. DS 682]